MSDSDKLTYKIGGFMDVTPSEIANAFGIDVKAVEIDGVRHDVVSGMSWRLLGRRLK